MFHDLKPHAEMVPSDVPWIDQMPKHWHVARGKSLFVKVEREPRPGDGVVTCFRDGVVTLRSRRRLTGFTESLKEIGYQGVRKGDLVIHAMDAFAGAAGVSDSDGKSTPVYGVCLPRRDANVHYYAAIVREMARTSWIMALSKGIRERSTDFRYEMFATQMLPVPPPDEQIAIVKYLAHASARIDKAIAAKRRLIGLLEETRGAAVDAVVLGREISEQTASPSPWFESIPAGWELRRCKTLTSLVTSGSRGWAEYYADRGPMFLQSGNLGRQLNLKLSNVQRVDLPESASEGVRTRVRGGDLLVCITGALTGNVALVPEVWSEEAYVNQHIALVRPRSGLANSEFLGYALKSVPAQTQFRESEYGGTKQGLGLDEVKNVEVLVPTRDVQAAIVAQVRARTADLDTAIGKASREVELLQEVRTRLIAEVVTGQVDVRLVAAGLPDQGLNGIDVVGCDLEPPEVDDLPADQD